MKKITFTWIVGLAVMVGSVNAVTIFETFDTDPTLGSWSSSVNGSAFTYLNDLTTDPGGAAYEGGGYLNAFMQRNPESDRYTTSLGQTFDQSQEFWMEFDSSTKAHYQYQRGLFGVFNSTSANNANVIADNFWRQQASSTSSDFGHRVTAMDSSASATYYTSDYVFLKNEPVRAKLHYYVDGSGEGVADLQLWRLNETGAADDVLLASNSGTILAAGQTLSYDSFGLGNIVGAVSSFTQRSRLDNLYFSTEGANATYVNPAFAVPEPGTLSLMVVTMGGLFVARRLRRR
jgi:hypothetical protein